jgi:hypothetical protein
MEEREKLVRELKEARAETLDRGPDHGRVWKTKWIGYKIALKRLHRFDEAEKEKAQERDNKA